MLKRPRSPSPNGQNKRACAAPAGAAPRVLVCTAADLAERPELAEAVRESLDATGLVVVTDILTEAQRAEVQARLAACFLDMFGETPCVAESGNGALIRAALDEGRAADALAIAAQSRAARDGHGLVGFSHFRLQPAPAESALVVDATGHPLDGVVFTHAPVHARVNQFIWSQATGVRRALEAATGADFVSFDGGMCRYVAPARGKHANPGRAARPCATSKPSATKFHTDTYPAELRRIQGIYFERTEGALRLAFVPASHRSTDGAGHGFSAHENAALRTDREAVLRRAIAPPDNAFVFFAQGVIHGECLFDLTARSDDGLFNRPTGPFDEADKMPVPAGELAVRMVLGLHRASYAPEERAALEAMAEHGFIPESIGGINGGRPSIGRNIVNRYNTQYQRRFAPSATAAAAFDAACAALGAAPRARGAAK